LRRPQQILWHRPQKHGRSNLSDNRTDPWYMPAPRLMRSTRIIAEVARMSRMWAWLVRRPLGIAGVIAVLIIAAIGWGLLRPSGNGAAAPEPTKAEPAKPEPGTFRPTPTQLAGLQIAPVETRAFRSEEETEGTIAIDDELTTQVFSPYSGRVTRLIAKLGDQVEPGAPLFAVEATEFVQAVNDLITALANLKTARSQLAQAVTNEKRGHELYLAKGGALKDWQQSQTDLTSAQNTVRSDEIALAAVRNRLRILGKSDREIDEIENGAPLDMEPVAYILAPINGAVTQRQVGLGQNILSVQAGASTPVFTIGDLSTVWLVANVREADASLIRIGEPLEVRVLAFPGRVFKAKISWVAPSIDANTHRLPVRADVENADGALKPGMFARFSIITGPAATLPAAPESAIVYEGETARVWVVRPDGAIASRMIRLGEAGDGMVEVLDGLSAGEKIVTSGTLFIDRAANGD
jgi:membrane fusion protein, heavy metal efflux system